MAGGQSLHINELELLAALFALKAFLKHVRDISVLLKSDNVTTVTYINHLGGTRSRVLYSQSLEGAVALVSPKRHNTQSTTPTRQGESQCGFHVSPLERQNRPDSQSSSVQHHQSGVGSTASGSFCDQILSAVAKLLQLASRSGSRGNRCFLSRLEEFTGLCSSSMVPHR